MTQDNLDSDDGRGIDRRGFMKRVGTGTAAAGLTVYGGNKALYETVGSHRGTAKAVVPAIAAGAVVIGSLYGGAKLGHELNKISGDDYTSTELHTEIYSRAIEVEDSVSKYKSFENLVAENSSQDVWEDGLYHFGLCYNNTSTDKTAEDCLNEWQDEMLTKLAEREQQILAHLNSDIRSLTHWAELVQNYEYIDDLENIFTMKYAYNSRYGDSHAQVSVFNYDAVANMEHELTTETYNQDEVAKILSPFRSDPTGYDGDISLDKITSDENVDTHELVDGRQIDVYSSWHPNVSLTNSENEFTGKLYIEGETVNRGGDPIDLVNFSVQPYQQGIDSIKGILGAKRRAEAINKIRDDVPQLMNDSKDMKEGIQTRWNRGELPLQKIASGWQLREEQGWEEGNAPLSALYFSKVTGENANIDAAITIKHYDNNSPSGESWSEEDEGTELSGYITTNNKDVTYKKGEVLNPSNFDEPFHFVLRSSGNVTKLNNPFKVVSITKWDDEGNPQDADQASQRNYTFNARDPDKYEDEYNETADVREEANNNPNTEIDYDLPDVGGGNVIPDSISESIAIYGVIGGIILFVAAWLKG